MGETMKSVDKHRLNDNKQTNMKPKEAYFFWLLGVIVATMPHGNLRLDGIDINLQYFA